jgi:phage terminase large subunit GpA-like protein
MHEEKFFPESGIIPSGTVAVTIGVDTQSDGFYWLVACWGRGLEVWLPLTGRIVGDMRSDAVWKRLADVLSTQWTDKAGNVYRLALSAIDVQGDCYPQTLEFLRAHGARLKLKGVRGHTTARAVGQRIGILRNVYRDNTTGVTVQNVDVDLAKSIVANMLARPEPGAGYVHLPRGANGEDKGGWDAETINELTAEYRRQTNSRGYTITRWHKKLGKPNHRGDCLVYALAALMMTRLKIDECAVQRIEARNVGKADVKPEPVKFGAQPIKIAGVSNWSGYLPRPNNSPFGVSGGDVW